nr:uncharacterized protein, mitochondrial [Quercus suber]
MRSAVAACGRCRFRLTSSCRFEFSEKTKVEEMRERPEAAAAVGLKYPIRVISEATVDPLTPKKEDEEQSPQNWIIKMLYDGDCPLCMREVNMLRERNKDHGTIKFVDISSDEYSPEENQGLDYKTVCSKQC